MGGGGGVRGATEAEENTIFSTLKMQFQHLLTHRLQGISRNANPKLLDKGDHFYYFITLKKVITSSPSGIKLKTKSVQIYE